MLTIAGVFAVIALMSSVTFRFVAGSLLVLLAESAIGLLIIGALLGVFK